MINKKEIPEYLYGIIPLADKWGISDDSEREIKIKTSTIEEIAEIVQIEDSKMELLSDWLCGEESLKEILSPSYITLSCFLMAYDYARVIIENNNES